MNWDEEFDSDFEELEDFDDIEEKASEITKNLLPIKSRDKYNQNYLHFKDWQLKKKVNSLTEDVFLVYFEELSKSVKPSTLWSRCSMIKSMVLLNHGVDMNKFAKLKKFLVLKSKGHVPKKSQVFTRAQIHQFLQEADDDNYLAFKVILIFGVFGACRSCEIVNIRVGDIEATESQYIITIRDTKNLYPRSFVIGSNYCSYIRKYASLRPEDIDSDRFFLAYHNKKCSRQAIGKNKVAEVPKLVAEFLKLSNPESYTGHAFRRTSATLLADSGATITMLKQHGGWRSNSVAEGYVENSIVRKKGIFDKIDQSGSASKQASLVINNSVLETNATSNNKENEKILSPINVVDKKKDIEVPFENNPVEDEVISLKSIENIENTPPSKKSKKSSLKKIPKNDENTINSIFENLDNKGPGWKFDNCRIKNFTVHIHSKNSEEKKL